jgi:hypothetical protein
MLLRVDENDFHAVLADVSRQLLVIVAPTYERRSTRVVEHYGAILGRLRTGKVAETVRFVMLSLEAAHQKDMLQTIQGANLSQTRETLSGSAFKATQQLLSYPRDGARVVHELLRNQIREMPDQVDVFVDISCLPKNVLFDILDFFFPTTEGEPGSRERARVREVFFLYAWAARYPVGIGPEFVGDMRAHYSGGSFRSFISNVQTATIALFAGGTGYDATLVTAQTRSLGVNASRTIFLYLNRHDLLASWGRFAQHVNILEEARQTGDRLDYVFSVGHAAHRLNNLVERTVRDHEKGERCAFAVAPFGPKPLSVCAFFGVRTYNRLVRRAGTKAMSDRCRGDLVYMAGSHNLSLYSLGVQHVHIYRAQFRK